MASLLFKPRFERIDEVLLSAARRRNPNVSSLEHALREPGVDLVEIFAEGNSFPNHYGKISGALWRLVDEIFKPADSPDDCPPGFSAKSVQVADIYEKPPAGGGPNCFLYLWANYEEPVMIGCPLIPQPLLNSGGTTGADTRLALRNLVTEIVERLNLVVPVALALSSPHEPG